MRKPFIRQKYTCIIPFYNENSSNVVKVVKEVYKVKEIDSIILVDDGSTDTSNYDYFCWYFTMKSVFPNKKITVKRLETNFGKTFAIYHALNYVENGNVFLCDADLKDLDSDDISNAILKYDMLKLDMLILRRLKIGFFPKLIRADTLLSGERILSKKDLAKIIQMGVSGYQLEVATNQYFLNKKSKNCFWSPSSAVNNYKYNKFKFLKGIAKDLKMYYSLVKYLGFLNFLKQIDSFCQEDV
jgi:glycosyltransferase involved in cell wall biosynthesis